MVDQFNARLQQLASNVAYGGRVLYVNCRGAGGNKAKWFDEIHPKTPGFGRVANRFKSAISAAFGVARPAKYLEESQEARISLD
jgi:hypothetical protein